MSRPTLSDRLSPEFRIAELQTRIGTMGDAMRLLADTIEANRDKIPHVVYADALLLRTLALTMTKDIPDSREPRS